MASQTKNSSTAFPRPHRWSLAPIIAGALLLGRAAAAGEPPAVDSQERAARLETMKRQAAAYMLTLQSAAPVALLLHDEPLLRFSNPVGGVPDGIVVLWKDGERPAVVAQVFQTKEGLWVHECQSLASAGLTMRLGDTLMWKPQGPAGDFQPVPGAPRAADSAGRRLLQMKAIAERFSASDDFKIHAADRETTRHELRLLPTPVYRYQDEKAGIDDGAVFAFVHGTDPEVFLVLEHDLEANGGGWRYALAPMTCWAVEATLDGRAAWSVPERLGKSRPEDAYHVWIHRPQE